MFDLLIDMAIIGVIGYGLYYLSLLFDKYLGDGKK